MPWTGKTEKTGIVPKQSSYGYSSKTLGGSPNFCPISSMLLGCLDFQQKSKTR